ncbi:hypothetical protein ACTXT7_008897 [Hymenolepis weldensis]
MGSVLIGAPPASEMTTHTGLVYLIKGGDQTPVSIEEGSMMLSLYQRLMLENAFLNGLGIRGTAYYIMVQNSNFIVPGLKLNEKSSLTGTPKGVIITNKMLIATVTGTMMNTNLTLFTQNDVYLSFLPLAHIFEQFNVYRSMFCRRFTTLRRMRSRPVSHKEISINFIAPSPGFIRALLNVSANHSTWPFDYEHQNFWETVKMRSRVLIVAIVFVNVIDITSGHLECESTNTK